MAVEVRKPTASYEDIEKWTNPNYCYDQYEVAGDETTYGYGDIGEVNGFPCIRFHTWESKEQTYTATILSVLWKTSIQNGDDEFGIEYTKDGENWLSLLDMGFHRSTTYVKESIALDANQDLTKVEVRINIDRIKGSDGCNLQISDIWTSGTYEEITQKNVTDAGSGSDATPSIKNALPISDIGITSVEKIYIENFLTVKDDSNVGIDGLSIKNSFIILDVGSGVDTIIVIIKILGTDSGSGSDAIVELINRFILSDTGSGSDFISVKLFKLVTDAGSGVDAIASKIFCIIQDNGSGNDTVIVIGKFLLSDTGSGADIISLISVKFMVSDTGVGTDAIVSILTQIPVADAGSGDDSTISILAKIPIADAGIGNDTPITVIVKIPVTDSTTGDDSTISISVTIPVSDTGLGTDAIAGILNKFTLLDSGSGVDAIIAKIFLLLSDTGSGVEAIDVALVIPIVDAGSAVDTIDFKIEVPLTEVGTGSDIITALLNKFTLSDTSVGADAIIVKLVKFLSDVGSGVDTFNIKTGIPIIDTASGVDSILSISAKIPITDSGSGVDILANLIIKALISEIATGVESDISISVGIPITDTGSGIDAIAGLVNRLSLSDVGSGIDDLAVQIQMSIIDTGSGNDVIANIKVSLIIVDSGTGIDAAILKLFSTISDTGAGADSVVAIGKYNIPDSGTGTDLIVSILSQVPVTDIGIGIDDIIKLITTALEKIGVGFFIEVPSPIVFAKILKSTDRSLPVPDLWYMSNLLTPQVDCVVEEQMRNYLYTYGSKVEGPCGLSTGTGKLTFTDLGGVTISSYSGTATPSISNNDINITAGTLYDLKLSDGTWIPNPADGYDISKNKNHATPSNLTESTQDNINTLQDLGFTAVIINEFDPIDRIPYDVYRKPIYVTLGSEFSVIEHPPGLYTLNDGGKIDFNSIRDKHMLDSEENPDVGIENPGSWTLGSGVSISNNKVVVDGTQGAPTYAYITANSTLYNVNFRKFEAVYRCVSRTAGQHKVMLGGYGGSDYSIFVGPMKVELTVDNPSSDNRLYYYFDADFIGEVELLSVREIIKEPVKYHLDDEVLLNSNFEDGFTNGLANDWSKYEIDNTVEEEINIVHVKGSAQKIIATDDIQDLGIEQSIDIDDCYINHSAWVFCSKDFGIDSIHLQLADNYNKAFTIPTRTWTKIYWNSHPGAIGSKAFRIYVDPANVVEGDYIIVDDCSFRQTILNPYFLHMFNKNAVVGNEDGFPEVYSAGMRSGNSNYDILNPYKWVFEELDPTYLSTYLQTAFMNKLFMKLIKNDNGDTIALKNILSYKDKLTGIDLKRVERYFGGE